MVMVSLQERQWATMKKKHHKTVYPEKPWQRKSDSELIKGTQAYRVIRKFGGAPRLGEILRELGHSIENSTIYRWDYPLEDGGSGGLIPIKWIPLIIKIARMDGIILNNDDLSPIPDKPIRDKHDNVKREHNAGELVDSKGVARSGELLQGYKEKKK